MLNRPELIPTTNMIRNLFYSSRSKSVHWVIVNSRVVLEEGRFVTIDKRKLLAETNKAAISLLARMGKRIEPNTLARRRQNTA